MTSKKEMEMKEKFIQKKLLLMRYIDKYKKLPANFELTEVGKCLKEGLIIPIERRKPRSQMQKLRRMFFTISPKGKKVFSELYNEIKKNNPIQRRNR
ncbi:MAG: hypothetical protein IMZ60_02755 [Actinobacteria bacterium]|nr:hypothetical protein [Actinomycetota bacterium]